MTRVFERLGSDGYPTRAAVYYDFGATRRKNGWIPITASAVAGLLKKHYDKAAMQALLREPSRSPFLAMMERRR